MKELTSFARIGTMPHRSYYIPFAEAEAPFSCSVNPYTTKQLRETTHDFDLPENDFVNVCLDLAMAGVGSASCGPALDAKYEIPGEGKNTFTFTF